MKYIFTNKDNKNQWEITCEYQLDQTMLPSVLSLPQQAVGKDSINQMLKFRNSILSTENIWGSFEVFS